MLVLSSIHWCVMSHRLTQKTVCQRNKLFQLNFVCRDNLTSRLVDNEINKCSTSSVLNGLGQISLNRNPTTSDTKMFVTFLTCSVFIPVLLQTVEVSFV